MWYIAVWKELNDREDLREKHILPFYGETHPQMRITLPFRKIGK